MTVTPARVTTTLTKIIGTISKTARVVVPTLSTFTHTASCTTSKQSTPDPICTITPTLVTAAALQTAAAKAKFRRVPDAMAIADRDTRIAERKARMAEKRALIKRSPDSATVTVTGRKSRGFHCHTND